MYASNGSGNHSFFWYGYPAGGGPVITSGPTTIVSQTTSALTSGPMAMVIKVRDLTWGCEANDSFFLVDKICKNSGIASLAESGVNVFPNPTSSKIYVELTDRMKLKNSKISFIDQLGRIVKEVSVPIPNSTIEIDIESFDRGIYFMVIKNRDEKVILYKKVSKD